MWISSEKKYVEKSLRTKKKIEKLIDKKIHHRKRFEVEKIYRGVSWAY